MQKVSKLLLVLLRIIAGFKLTLKTASLVLVNLTFWFMLAPVWVHVLSFIIQTYPTFKTYFQVFPTPGQLRFLVFGEGSQCALFQNSKSAEVCTIDFY